MQFLRRNQRAGAAIVVCILVTLVFIGCRAEPPKPVAIEGTWRAVLQSPGGELPFTLRITRRANALDAVIVNGAERAPASEAIIIGSSVSIRFDWYDSRIVA